METFLKEARFVSGGRFVATGSDCGYLFVWHKASGRLLRKVRADASVVNGVVCHPRLPFLLTCGIDASVKVPPPPFTPPVLTGHAASLPPYQPDTPRPFPRTNRTRLVPPPVPTGHASSLPPYQPDTPRPSPRTNQTRLVPPPVPTGHAASLPPY